MSYSTKSRKLLPVPSDPDFEVPLPSEADFNATGDFVEDEALLATGAWDDAPDDEEPGPDVEDD